MIYIFAVFVVIAAITGHFHGKAAERNSHNESFTEDEFRKILAEAFPDSAFSEEEISRAMRTSSGHFDGKDIIVAMAKIVLLEREACK